MSLDRVVAAAAVVLFALLAPAAGARESGASDDPRPASRPDTALYHVAPVSVRGARAVATPGGSSAVEAVLDSTAPRPAPTLEHVLRGLPLMVVRANSRGEVQPSLRGGEDRQIAVLVDGVPITLAWDHRGDLSIVPATAARSVTVHRGLSSLLQGPNALAGAVHVDIARGPRADAAPAPLAIDAGADHTGARSAALVAGVLCARGTGHWLARAGAGYRGSDGFVLPRALRDSDPAAYARLTADGDRRLNTDIEALDGFVSLRGVSGSGAWAAFTGAGYRAERGVAPEANTGDPRLWRYPFQARGLGALSAGTGTRETPWGRGDLEMSLGADASRTEIDEYDALDYATVSARERDDDRTLTARLLGDHTVGDRGDLRMALTYGDVTHDEWIDTDPMPGNEAPQRYRQRLWSVAGEGDWRFGNSLPIRVSLGGAADGAETPLSSDKPPLGRLQDWAGRAGATAVLRQGKLLVHVSGGRRARFPSLRELYSGALGRFLENPGLRAETQRVFEGGATLRHRTGELQVVGFQQTLDDAITRITVATPSGNRFQRVNLGRIVARGVELIGTASAGPFAFGGGGTLQDVSSRDAAGAATELEYEPAAFGSLWVEAPLAWGARVTLAANGATRLRYVDLDSGAFATLAPAAQVDVRLARGFAIAEQGPWRRLDAVLAVENFGDQVVFDQAGLPRPGRTMRLQIRVQ